MIFADLMKEAFEGIDGAYGGTVMGVDGIPIENYIVDPEKFNVEAFGVGYCKVVDEVRNAGEVLKIGNVEEVTIELDGSKILVRIIVQEYFLAMVVSDEANEAKVRFRMRKVSYKTKEELGL